MPPRRHPHAARPRALARLARVVAAAADLSHALDAIARCARHALGTDVVALWIVDDAGALDLVATSGGRASRDAAVLTRAADVARRVVRRRRLVHGRAIRGIPLMRDGHVLGVLGVYGRRPSRWGRDDGVFVAMLAALAAAAIERARLQARERRYRQLFARSLVGAFRASRDGVIGECNEAFARLLGYDVADELCGRRLGDFHADHRDVAWLATALAPGRAVRDAEIRLRRKDGGEVSVLMSVREIAEDAGGLEGVTVDLSDRKRAEAAARAVESVRSVASLAAAAAHEIFNPLTVVMGSLDLLGRRGTHDPAAAEWIVRGRDAARRIRDIVERMASITRLHAMPPSPGLPPMLDITQSSDAPPTPDAG